MVLDINKVSEEIIQLVGEYAFHVDALRDVNERLVRCDCPYCAAQQLRYLKHIAHMGGAIKISKQDRSN
ncbi:hypothetical protein [Solibacillus sp. FSL K6-1523]|uniref:hypothetical protein n=1 Tax=Solibacillus sp. FSL K6-1523 TaxID=2921471 RepID=UPI0030FB68AA